MNACMHAYIIGINVEYCIWQYSKTWEQNAISEILMLFHTIGIYFRSTNFRGQKVSRGKKLAKCLV